MVVTYYLSQFSWVRNLRVAQLAGPGLMLSWGGRQVLAGLHHLKSQLGLEDLFSRWSLFPWASLWSPPMSSGHGGQLSQGGQPEFLR